MSSVAGRGGTSQTGNTPFIVADPAERVPGYFDASQ
jgi:hypothetical protein